MQSMKCSHSTRSGSTFGNRGEKCPRARDILARSARRPRRSPCRRRQLALERHVVEGRHPLEPTTVNRRSLCGSSQHRCRWAARPEGSAGSRRRRPRRPRARRTLRARQPRGLFAGEIQHDRDVVGAEAPKSVLVRAELAQIQPVAVDVVDASRARRVGQLLQRARQGGTRAGARPSAVRPRPRRRAPPARRPRPTARAASRRSSACPPPARAMASSAWVGTGVASTTASSSGRRAGPRDRPVIRASGKLSAALPRGRRPSRRTATQLAARDGGEVAGEVRPPVAEAGDAADNLGHRHRASSRISVRASPRRVRTPRDRRRKARAARRRRAPSAQRGLRSRSTSVFQPISTVSIHSVRRRSVSRHAGKVRLLLDPAGIREHGRGVAEQRGELDVARAAGDDRPALRASRSSSPPLAGAARARVHREEHRRGHAPATARRAPQPLRVVDVAGPMRGREHVDPGSTPRASTNRPAAGRGCTLERDVDHHVADQLDSPRRRTPRSRLSTAAPTSTAAGRSRGRRAPG